MTQQTMASAAPNMINGLDCDAAMATINAIKSDPSLAHFQFRARNCWISGGENRSTIKGFYGAGAEDTSRSHAFEFTNGEPPVCAGQYR